MGRLFAGTQWDRPPRCERCDQLEEDCKCPPETERPTELLDPSKQTARVRIEKRAKGKKVTTVAGLDPDRNDLKALTTRLKTGCGGGGTLQDDGTIEVQGEHLDRVIALLSEIGYKTKRG